MRDEWIDPVELPFSEDEFFRAFRLLMSEEKARDAAHYLVSVVRSTEEYPVIAEVSGDQAGDRLDRPVWEISDEAFALLSLLSEDLGKRVESYIEARSKDYREHLLRNRLVRPNGVILTEPDDQVLAEVDDVLREYASDWNKVLKRVRARVSRQSRRK